MTDVAAPRTNAASNNLTESTDDSHKDSVHPGVCGPDGTSAFRSPESSGVSSSGLANAPRTERSKVLGRSQRPEIEADQDEKTDADDHKETKSPQVRLWNLTVWPLPPHMQWMVDPFRSWALFKPVLRSAIIAWLMMIFMVVSPVEKQLGNASFLVIVFSLLQPAELPLTGILEREFFMLLFALCSWAWACIATAISHAARGNKLSAANTSIVEVFSGKYVEKAPSIVCAVFLAFGAAVCLYLKIRFGPSPFLFSSIIACLALDILLTSAPLFPYPNYLLGKTILFPMAVKTGVTIIVSILCFPKSVNSLFVDRVVLVLDPLSEALRFQMEQFKSSPLSSDFDFLKVRNTVGQAERAVPLVAAATRLLGREISFGLASGEDLRTIEGLVRALVAPANGWSQYLAVISSDLQNCHFPKAEVPATRPPSPSHTPRMRTPYASRPSSRPQTPTQSRLDLHEAMHEEHDTGSQADRSGQEAPSHGMGDVPDPLDFNGNSRPTSVAHDRVGRLNLLLSKAPIYSHFQHRSQPSTESPHPSPGSHHQHRHGFFSSHHWGNEAHHTVGTWSSLRYASLEQKLHTKSADFITDQVFSALGESSENIMRTNADAIDHVVSWFHTLNNQRYQLFLARFTGKTPLRGRDSHQRSLLEVIDSMEKALQYFRDVERLRVVDLFRASIEGSGSAKAFPHRYLFQAFVHQHTNIVFSERLLKLLRELERLATERSRGQLWMPSLPRMFRWETWAGVASSAQGREKSMGDLGAEGAEDMDHPDDNWYRTQGLGGASPRDPDCLEPTTTLQKLGTAVHRWFERLWHGNLLFAVKAAILTVLLALPFYLSASAGFAQRQKGIWTLFIAQLSFGRHRGDSIFALVSRTLCTVAGAVVAMLIWYISAGSGRASPYALMVVWAFAVVPIFVFRIYWPYSPQTAIITALTIAVCLGYSWKDSYNPAPYTSPGYGWQVAWRRLVEVMMGATAAVIWSLVPPSSTLRQYLRHSHAACIHRLGILHCKLIAFTLNHDGGVDDIDPIVLSSEIISLRAKLRQLDARKAQVAYETSLRGRWPRERYEMLFETELLLSKLLSATVIISQQLGPGYSRALLRRTRFAQQGFMADVLTAYSLCSTALRTAQPLPQLSPVLFSRYLSEAGFLFRAPNAERDNEYDLEDEQKLGVPQHLTLKVLQSEEYCAFAVGVVTLSQMVRTLDQLVLACKQLVGESFEVPAELYYGAQKKADEDRR
ncbi:unnamed protein product [Parajaminaea phylloscopi]